MKSLIGIFCCCSCLLFGQQQGTTDTADLVGALSSCSHLSTEEQSFASQLGPMHQMLFCGKFTEGQRQEAMEMVKKSQQPPKQGLWESTADTFGMTPDEAVEEILKKNRKSPGKSEKTPSS